MRAFKHTSQKMDRHTEHTKPRSIARCVCMQHAVSMGLGFKYMARLP